MDTATDLDTETFISSDRVYNDLSVPSPAGWSGSVSVPTDSPRNANSVDQAQVPFGRSIIIISS